jgi:predicted nucleotidyltransferase
MSYLSVFTTQLSNLSEQLVEIFPGDTHLRVAQNFISLMKTANPRKLQELFGDVIKPYKDHIMEKNEAFFLEHDYGELSDRAKDQDSANAIMTSLKNNWKNMSEENKETTWKYFQVLVKLNEKMTEA